MMRQLPYLALLFFLAATRLTAADVAAAIYHGGDVVTIDDKQPAAEAVAIKGGKIIAVGPGGRDESGKLIPIDLKKGDVVLFGKWSGTEIKIDGEELLIMKESDVMGVMEK